MSIQLENLRRDLRGRLETDKQMSAIWAIVPLLPIIITIISVIAIIALAVSAATAPATAPSSAILGVFGFFSILYFGYFIFVIITALMVFFLVRRRNLHFNRQILLYEDLVSISKELASKKNVDVSMLINNMDRSLREARLEEVEKNATLWALLSFSFGLIYSGYFLLKDFYKHERREDLFIQDFLRTLYQLGVPINLPYRNPPIPDRSFALYLVLTWITGGIFGVYWVYVLVADPNNHFRQQMSIEDTVMAQVSPLLMSPSQSTPPSPSQPPAPS